ncbi:hypothetical protein [Paraglaciecola arctica]|uniref:hypothetical protein n=1 Tax=Paraglaciecola arctica TaxID=1128911 RepID=UPI001C0714D1|nr:hypothetical protein [Paraglaciecola arctica]MBU3005384.1 hypothetical protein [Paraglaciecola arctica]
MEIFPGIGTDLIRFGMTEPEIFRLLGKADKTYVTDENCKRLQFNRLRMELSFEPENNDRLGWIEVHNPDVLWGGRSLIGLSKNEVLKFVSDLLKLEPEIEDYGSFLSISYYEKWVELQFQFDRLENINFGVLYDNNEVPQWPSL